MYAGTIVEEGPVAEIFDEPRHPYTRGLLAARARRSTTSGSLDAIPGQVPDLRERPTGCPFHPRCPARAAICARADAVPRRRSATGHLAACHFWREVA